MENAPEINEDQDQTKRVEPVAGSSNAAAEPEPTARPNGIVATFREALRRVREGERRAAVRRPSGATPVSERNARNRDRTKTMLVMVGGIVFALIVFLGLFSSRSQTRREMVARRGNPSLGRPELQVDSGTRPGSVTPLLNAEVAGQQPASDELTPEDINGTSRPRAETGGLRNRPVFAPKRAATVIGRKANSGTKPVPPDASQFPDPALEAYRQQVAHPSGAASGSASAGRIPTPAPMPALSAPPQPATPVSDSEPLAKPSLVYVRTASAGALTSEPPLGPAAATEPAFVEPTRWSGLPIGTRLIARLQMAVSSAIKAPVVAVVEAHYERDGEIVVPAGTKAFGDLQTANRSGYVGIRFHTLQLPDGSTEKVEATAIGLDFGPLKGQVTGTNRGKQFLARALTGVGTVAAFAVGQPGGLSGPLDNSILLRERIAQNVGIAGEQELTTLAYNQDVVVTVPGNTRFFLVLQQDTRPDAGRRNAGPAGGQPVGTRSAASNTAQMALPSAAEVRELLGLKQEIERLYRAASATAPRQ